MSRSADPRKRAEILESARLVFKEKGYAQARMADIAERAGVASGTVYLYFPAKEALVSALTEDHLYRLAAVLDTTLSGPAPLPLQLAHAIHAVFEFAVAERDVASLVWLDKGLTVKTTSSPGWNGVRQRIRQSLAAAMEAGVVRRYDPEVLSDLIIGLLIWSLDACIVHGHGDLALYRQTVLQLLQGALLTA